MCTSLLYFDANERAYLGRTLELSLDLPYQVAFFPKELPVSSEVKGHPKLSWTMRHTVIAVTMPISPSTLGKAFGSADLKIVEGLNDAGLTFSVQSYSQTSGPQEPFDSTHPALSAADLGTFILGQFSSVAEVKAALTDMPIVLESIAILGGLKMPFHYSVHDATGASLVIEFHHGVRTIYENPVGVLTNAPQFSWHLTNLNNYTFLTNIDRSKARFLDYEVEQPGSGIAKAGLPGTDTSVDRFIRAVFYAQFAEKQSDPDRAVQMVAHIMNNFDRPRGITIDPPNLGSNHLQFEGHTRETTPTEFTTWTSLSDLTRRRLFLRDSGGMNYTYIDLTTLTGDTEFFATPMAKLTPPITNSTAAFTSAKSVRGS